MNDAPSSNGKHDVWTHRMVVGGLALLTLFSGLNITILQMSGHDIPPSLPLLGSTALGALTAMLAAIMRQPDSR
jgi:hypothetical protein